MRDHLSPPEPGLTHRGNGRALPGADTIVAVATPPGEGGVAVVRLTGPGSEGILRTLFRRSPPPPWESHRLYHGMVHRPDDGAPVDEVLAVVMREPRSYTRETVAEIHCHGGSVVAGQVVDLCLGCGARTARPGEFTLRAFLNGRLDLAQAESVLSLIRARTRAGARLAAEGLAGALSRRVATLRSDLLGCLVGLEAEIDFGDEVPGVDPAGTRRQVVEALDSVKALLEGAEEGRLQSEGVTAVLLGPPNTGKSTLLNALLGEERALVTPVPGTTRDRLEEPAVLDGLCVRLVDTAGLRDTADPVEVLGMARTREAAARCEVAVVVLDGSQSWPEAVEELAEACRERPVVVVLNKRDLGCALRAEEVRARFGGGCVVETSLVAPGGVAPVRGALARAARGAAGDRAGEVYSMTLRQVEVLRRCRGHLAHVLEALEAGMPVDCQAADLRPAVACLGEITGEDVTEDILDRVFSTFCLGK